MVNPSSLRTNIFVIIRQSGTYVMALEILLNKIFEYICITCKQWHLRKKIIGNYDFELLYNVLSTNDN